MVYGVLTSIYHILHTICDMQYTINDNVCIYIYKYTPCTIYCILCNVLYVYICCKVLFIDNIQSKWSCGPLKVQRLFHQLRHGRHAVVSLQGWRVELREQRQLRGRGPAIPEGLAAFDGAGDLNLQNRLKDTVQNPSYGALLAGISIQGMRSKSKS